MRVTIVASVTEQNKKNPKIDEISYYELYSIATTSFTPPQTLTFFQLHSITTKTCKTQQQTCTEHLPKNCDSLFTSSYYTPHSISTSSFTPRYALDIPSPHSIATSSNKTQQLMRTKHFPRRPILSLLLSSATTTTRDDGRQQ